MYSPLDLREKILLKSAVSAVHCVFAHDMHMACIEFGREQGKGGICRASHLAAYQFHLLSIFDVIKDFRPGFAYNIH